MTCHTCRPQVFRRRTSAAYRHPSHQNPIDLPRTALLHLFLQLPSTYTTAPVTAIALRASVKRVPRLHFSQHTQHSIEQTQLRKHSAAAVIDFFWFPIPAPSSRAGLSLRLPLLRNIPPVCLNFFFFFCSLSYSLILECPSAATARGHGYVNW